MSDEELEKKCAEALDRMMHDDQYFLHLLIKAFMIRCERLTKELESER